MAMTALKQSGFSCFLVAVWCITVAVPYGWHRYEGRGLKNYNAGLYKYEVSKGSAGQAISLATGLAAKARVVHKDKGEKLVSLIGEGTFWMASVEEDNCMPYVDQFAVIPGSREYCNMWRRMRSASSIVAGCIIAGSLLQFTSAALSFNAGGEGDFCCKFRKMTGIAGPVIGLIGLTIYFVMTMDFPNPGSGTRCFGPTFWLAVTTGILLTAVSTLLVCMDSGAGKYQGNADVEAKAVDLMPGPPTYHQPPVDYQTFGSPPNGAQGPPHFVPGGASQGLQAYQAPPGSSMYRSGSPAPANPTGSMYRSGSPPHNRLSFNAGPNPMGSMYRAGSPLPGSGPALALPSWGITAPPSRTPSPSPPPSPRQAIPGLAKSHPFRGAEASYEA